MPRHSETTLAAIKNAVDIVALVGEYTARAPHREAGTRLFVRSTTTTIRRSISIRIASLTSAGVAGRAAMFSILCRTYERVDFPEALRMLADRAGVALEKPSQRPPASPRACRRPSSLR